MDHELPHHPTDTAFYSPNRDKEIERCLRSALHAYTARWLPLFMQREPSGYSVQCDEIALACWREARKDMLKVINRPSYRSVLALYLFGQTPVPLGIPQEEELDGLNGVVCSQTAFLHVQQLRERLRSCQFNGSEVSAWSDTAASDISTPSTNPTEEYLNLETRAFWAVVTWATSDSMTLNFRSNLSPGLKGACWEPMWQLAKGFLVASFHDRTEAWRRPGFRVSDDMTPQITSAASICAIYTWQTIASLKEGLREGVEEAIVQSAWKALVDAVDIFQTTIHPILNNLERQLHFVSQVDRLNWYEIVLLYYLGILILIDALEAANRPDLLHGLAQMSLDAEHECFNVLHFGLESTYTIDPDQGPGQNQRDSNAGACSASGGAGVEFPTRPVTVPLVAIDPYPHHVVAAVRLMNKTFLRQYYDGTIKREAYLHLSSKLLKALDRLPQNTKAVHSAQENLRRSLSEFDAVTAAGHDREFEVARNVPTPTGGATPCAWPPKS